MKVFVSAVFWVYFTQVTQLSASSTINEVPFDEGRILVSWSYDEEAHKLSDTTRAQINNIPEKRHVIIIIINKQGQMISRMRVLIIQAKGITNSKSLQIIM